jgi:hypothetical protein
MSEPLTIECQVHFKRQARGRKELHTGEEPPRPACEPERVPRVTRLLALAHRFDGLIRAGVVRDYAELARLGQVTRARISQVMALLQLTPDIQEAILFLPRTVRGRDPIQMYDLLPIALVLDWKTQRRLWERLVGRSPG